MPELTPENAPAWLAANGFTARACQCVELGGGVSNKVILADMPGQRAVLKQALGKLRVEREWLSDPARIFRESAAMNWLHGKVRGGHIPRLLAEDRAGFTIAMEAAPASAEMWKTGLFGGEFDTASAHSAGTLLGSIISASRNNEEAQRLFGDQTVFDQLRIDPYYRFTAHRHPDVAPYIDALITRSAARRVSLVHGDWSPKNLLVAGPEIWAIDWEVVHYGDPSYDVAFLLNHLLLKSIAMPQNRSALAALAGVFMAALHRELPTESSWLEPAALEHLPALLLARVDGKSPAEYLDEPMRVTAWQLGLQLIARPARSISEVFTR